MAKTSPMTITEKILAAHAGKKQALPGVPFDCRVDLCFGNDIPAPERLPAPRPEAPGPPSTVTIFQLTDRTARKTMAGMRRTGR